MADFRLFAGRNKRGGLFAAIGPAHFRLIVCWAPGERWRCGATCFQVGLGPGRYVALVLGERMDDAPRSIALGPVQVVYSTQRRPAP